MTLDKLSRGAVVLVAFPFTDLSATKVRPALVLSDREFHRRHRDVILAAISSVVERAEGIPTNVLLGTGVAAFRQSGLRVALGLSPARGSDDAHPGASLLKEARQCRL